MPKGGAQKTGHCQVLDAQNASSCSRGDVYLSVSELLALDQYLRRFNEGLAENPIFYRGANILDSLAESEELTIFIAAKYHEEFETDTVSRWDMRALTRFTRTKLAGMHIDIQDVLLRDRIAQIKEDSWIEMLKDDRAKVTIGSPLACPASEYLMAFSTLQDFLALDP